jgi:hypothetical protein
MFRFVLNGASSIKLAIIPQIWLKAHGNAQNRYFPHSLLIGFNGIQVIPLQAEKPFIKYDTQ